MTNAQIARLRELEDMDADGVELSPDEYEELRELIALENADFIQRHHI